MSRVLIDFASPDSVTPWSPIDDVVMGGRSHSGLVHESAGHASFRGVVSLEQNGGFASVRSAPLATSCDGAVAFILEVRGDGKRYKFNVRTDDDFDGINYQAEFDTIAGVWCDIRLAVAGFVPTFRGRVLAAAPALDPGRVRQLGLLIAGRQAGPFALDLCAIRLE